MSFFFSLWKVLDKDKGSSWKGRQVSCKNLVTSEGRERRKLIQHSDPSSAVSSAAGTKAPGIIAPFQPLIQSVRLCTPMVRRWRWATAHISGYRTEQRKWQRMIGGLLYLVLIKMKHGNKKFQVETINIRTQDGGQTRGKTWWLKAAILKNHKLRFLCLLFSARLVLDKTRLINKGKLDPRCRRDVQEN